MAEPNIEIKFDQAALQGMVEKWVMEQMTEETRNQVLAQAVKYLMTTPNTNYGPRESPLQQAFNRAIETVMYQVARDLIENNEEVKDKLTAMMGESMTIFLQTSYHDAKEPFIKKMGEALSEVFTRRD